MPYRLHRCVECPKCHTRYVMECLQRAHYHEFKLSELKAYAVPRDVYVRGYGSTDETVLPDDQRKQAS